MIEVILPSGSEIDALMMTFWLISPVIREVRTIVGGLFTKASDCPKVTVLGPENIMTLWIAKRDIVNDVILELKKTKKRS
jgi:hypothetical protein